MVLQSSERQMNLLSMAARARRIISGGLIVEQAIKKGQAKLVLIAADSAVETKNTYIKLADKYQVPYAMLLDRNLLGSCIGKDYRAIAALTDEGFAKGLTKLLEETV